MNFREWATEVRRHVLTEEVGPDQAERTLVRSPLLAPRLPDDLKGDGLLSWRPSPDGAGHHPRPDEARAREMGLTVEQWRRLAR